MVVKVLRDNSIFILVILIFLSGCQLTTTGEKKSVLNEELNIGDKEQLIEKEVSLIEPNEEILAKSDQELNLKEIEPVVEKEYSAKETNSLSRVIIFNP